SATVSTFGVASSVITTASACCLPVDPLPMLILPPCLTQVTEAGSKPARSLPATLTCAGLLLPVATLAGPAEWPPFEQATRADAQPMVPIAAARRRFTGVPSFMRRPVGDDIRASTGGETCYRSQLRGAHPIGCVDTTPMQGRYEGRVRCPALNG